MKLKNEFLLFYLSGLCSALPLFVSLISATFVSLKFLRDMKLNLDISECHFPFKISFTHKATVKHLNLLEIFDI